MSFSYCGLAVTDRGGEGGAEAATLTGSLKESLAENRMATPASQWAQGRNRCSTDRQPEAERADVGNQRSTLTVLWQSSTPAGLARASAGLPRPVRMPPPAQWGAVAGSFCRELRATLSGPGHMPRPVGTHGGALPSSRVTEPHPFPCDLPPRCAGPCTRVQRTQQKQGLKWA